MSITGGMMVGGPVIKKAGISILALAASEGGKFAVEKLAEKALKNKRTKISKKKVAFTTAMAGGVLVAGKLLYDAAQEEENIDN